MKKAKIVLIVAVSVLALIVILQNTEAVKTKFLFMTVEMSRALLLIMTFLAGFVAGLVAMSYLLKAKPKQQQQT